MRRNLPTRRLIASGLPLVLLVLVVVVATVTRVQRVPAVATSKTDSTPEGLSPIVRVHEPSETQVESDQPGITGASKNLIIAFERGLPIDISVSGGESKTFLFRKRKALAYAFKFSLGSDEDGQIAPRILSYEGLPVDGRSNGATASVVFVNNAIGAVVRDRDGTTTYVRTNAETGLLESRREEPEDIQLACAPNIGSTYTMRSPERAIAHFRSWHGGASIQHTPDTATLSGFDPATGELDKYINPIASASLYDLSLSDALLLLVLDKEATGSGSESNLASKASQYLAMISNVAALYENQLGIRLLVQELIMIPNTSAYQDIPSRNEIEDFAEWAETHRPVDTYGWSMASKFGAGLSRDVLGVAYIDAIGSDSGVSVCSTDGGWDVLAHEMGHNLGTGHSQGGIMNASSQNGLERSFFTTVSRNETAAKDIYDYSRTRLYGEATLRHPEEIPFAQSDRVTTSVGSPVQFDPLENDDTSVLNGDTNTLTLVEVGAVTPFSAGSAEITGSDIVFTPSDDFEGTAWFSYTIRGSAGPGWLHSSEVAVIVGTSSNSNEITLPPGGSYSLIVPSTSGLTQPAQARIDVSRDDRSLLILRAEPSASGTETFRAGGREYTINYTPPGPITRPDVFTYDGVSGQLSFNPLLNDEGAGERWIYPITPTIGVGTTGHDPDGIDLFPTTFRLVSAENLSPEQGDLITTTRPVTIGGRRTDVLDERLVFEPSAESKGSAQIEYVVEDATGERATGTVTILLPVSTQRLITSATSARVLVPESDQDESEWMLPDFDDSEWEEGSVAVGFESGNGYQNLISTDVEDAMSDRFSTVYVRIPFEIESPSEVSRLVLNMSYDDGFVAYLNGSEVARANAQGTAPLGWDAEASSNNPDSQARQFAPFDLSPHVSLLREGSNTLAIHGLNVAADSSDFLLIPTLDAITIEPIDSGETDTLFQITGIHRNHDGGLRISWASVAGRTYQLQSAPTLSANSWQTLVIATATNGETSIEIQSPEEQESYFRVSVSP